MSDVTFVLDDTEVRALLERAQIGIRELSRRLIPELKLAADEEGASRSVTWHTKETQGVEADQWWAHFLAHGTKAHGAIYAPRLVFAIDGGVVSPDRVAGIAADPFDERAARRTESRADVVLRESIGG